MPSAPALPVAPDDLATLRHWANATQAPAVLVQRAKLLLLAAEGASNTEITGQCPSRSGLGALEERMVRMVVGH